MEIRPEDESVRRFLLCDVGATCLFDTINYMFHMPSVIVPYPTHYRLAFAFCGIIYPLAYRLPFKYCIGHGKGYKMENRLTDSLGLKGVLGDMHFQQVLKIFTIPLDRFTNRIIYFFNNPFLDGRITILEETG